MMMMMMMAMLFCCSPKAKFFVMLVCCPLPTDRKMRNWCPDNARVMVFFFFFFFFFLKMSDVGRRICTIKFAIQWLKKHLYMRFDNAFRPSFPHLEILKKILENSTDLTVHG